MTEPLTGCRILLVDDDADFAAVCRRTLQVAGHQVEICTDGAEACQKLRQSTYDVLFTDLKMAGIDGLQVLDVAKEQNPDMPVLLLTGHPSIPTVVEAIKGGAFDYLTKPLRPGELLAATERIRAFSRVVRANRELRANLEEDSSNVNLIGSSQKMLEVFSVLRRIAVTDASVLLYGESGTGKELFARRLHELSPRRGGPFITVDSASLPEHLMESELFGHMPDAFTGAATEKIGLVEMADVGTLFLDEISELELTLQAKLLRVLEERSIRKVGGRSWQAVDFRLVTATNRDLQQMVSEGRFREDLYFRINVVQLDIPPLRERRADIPLLARFFLQQQSQEHGLSVKGLTREALTVLKSQPWPGNVRELENLIVRAVCLSSNEYLGPEDFQANPFDGEDSKEPAATSYAEAKESALGEFEVAYLSRLLRLHAGNVSAAARNAGVSRTTLRTLLKKHGLRSSHFVPVPEST